MTQIAVMCGATCAIVRVLTTSAYSSGWTLYYKRSSASSYSSVSLTRNSNLYFISSSWAAEVYGLSANTTYQFYVVAGSTSNTITATTCQRGTFRYTLDYAEGTSSSSYTSQYNFAKTMLDEFQDKMIAVGFNINTYDSSWTPLFLVDANASSNYTTDLKDEIHLRTTGLFTGNEERTRFVIAHEFRHLIFFDYNPSGGAGPFLGYASDAESERLPSTQAGMENFYKMISFLSCGTREIYGYYGENSGIEDQSHQYLITLFELKALAKNCDNAYITEPS